MKMHSTTQHIVSSTHGGPWENYSSISFSLHDLKKTTSISSLLEEDSGTQNRPGLSTTTISKKKKQYSHASLCNGKFQIEYSY